MKTSTLLSSALENLYLTKYCGGENKKRMCIGMCSCIEISAKEIYGPEFIHKRWVTQSLAFSYVKRIIPINRQDYLYSTELLSHSEIFYQQMRRARILTLAIEIAQNLGD